MKCVFLGGVKGYVVLLRGSEVKRREGGSSKRLHLAVCLSTGEEGQAWKGGSAGRKSRGICSRWKEVSRCRGYGDYRKAFTFHILDTPITWQSSSGT